ncbi:MAG: heparinase II/III family protein, partial [Candidatus Cryptobacteroides sp.]
SHTKSFAFTFRQAWYFADRFSDPGSLFLDLKEIESGKPLDMTERLSPLFLIYASRYDGAPVEQPSDKVYYGKSEIPIVVARTGWDKDDIYLGIKGGRADYSHSHMDVGSFVYEADGVRWASESHIKGGYPVIEKQLKPKGVSLFSYRQTSWRWKVFSYRPQEHSTLIINDKLHIPSGEGIFTEIIDEPGRKGAVIDITAPLGQDVDSAVRTIEIVDDEYLRITDVITASDLGPVDVRFNIMSDAYSMATKEGVILTSGNSAAFLSATGAKVRYQTWSANPTDYPNDVNSYLSLEDGTSICGYVYTVPSGKTRTVVTTLRTH